MLSLTEKEVEQLAHQLIKGNICFYQLDKKKIYQMPDDEDYFNYDLTPDEEDILDAIDENPENYLELTKMEPAQEHQMMQDFIDRKVKERALAEDLVNVLSKPKPITGFKFQIEESKYKNDWIEFRTWKYQDWVKEQVDSFNYTED
jgi:hypothetical protein